MKRSIFLTATLAVLALGLAHAAGDVQSDPIVLKSGQSSVQASAGTTTFIQMTQDPAAWGIDPTSTNFEVYVNSDGYAPNTTKSLGDMFWVTPDGTPSNWAVYVPDSESTLQGNVQNIYGLRIPAGTAAGDYQLQMHVRDNLNGNVYSFPLTVTIPASFK